MKKKIFGAVIIIAIVVGAMINVNLNKVSNKGDLGLANVEALAQSEGVTITCGATTGACWTQSYFLKFCGPRSYYQCVRSDSPSNSCTNPC